MDKVQLSQNGSEWIEALCKKFNKSPDEIIKLVLNAFMETFNEDIGSIIKHLQLEDSK